MLLISHHLLTVTYNHFPPFSLYEWDQLMNYLIIRNSSNMVCTRSCPLIGFLKSSITPHTVGMLIIWITLFFQHPGNNPEHLARFLHCSSIPFYSFYRDAPPKMGKCGNFFQVGSFFDHCCLPQVLGFTIIHMIILWAVLIPCVLVRGCLLTPWQDGAPPCLSWPQPN